jgi:hypothetical protein
MQIPQEQDGLDQGFSLDGFTGLLNRLRESKDRQVKKTKITGRQDSNSSIVCAIMTSSVPQKVRLMLTTGLI